MNYWLLLEKSDETRISKGIDGYQDQTGEFYRYDSLVGNHKNLAEGDFVVLRKEEEIVGVGKIKEIVPSADTKIHRRCPNCNSTDVRERAKKQPKWKCGKCAFEFSAPKETIVEVQSFVALISDFAKLSNPPSVRAVKLCSATADGAASQLSMLRLDPVKIQTLFEATALSPSSRSLSTGTGGQGFGLSQPERRAVELRAMHLARVLYENMGWTVIDTSASQPFDFHAKKDAHERFIEVKGTTGKGLSILLTCGEVEHVRRQCANCALVVVSAIALEQNAGEWIAKGGEITTHLEPWILSDKSLSPTQYRYEIESV